MNETKVSFTAISTACNRAYHSLHDNPKLFDDFLACRLIPDDMRVRMEQHLTGKEVDEIERAGSYSNQTIPTGSLVKATIVLSRSRYTEDKIEEDVKQGLKQYVILGAGLDTFAFRQPELMKQLEVFEIDHPVTQEFKLHRLAELGWKHPTKLHFVPIDFTKENLIVGLTRSSAYDRNAKSIFSWLGVTAYLTREEIFATLTSITKIAPVGSAIVFDYMDSNAFISGKSSPEMQKKLEFLRKIGEPMRTGFNPSTLAEDLANLGFRLKENLSPPDVERRYFQGRTDGYHAQRYEYIAYATVE